MKKYEPLLDAAIIAGVFLCIAMMGYTTANAQNPASPVYAYRIFIQSVCGVLIGLGTLIFYRGISVYKDQAVGGFKLVSGELEHANIARGDGPLFGDGVVVDRSDNMVDTIQKVTDLFMTGDCDYIIIESSSGDRVVLVHIDEATFCPPIPADQIKRGRVIHKVDPKLLSANVSDLHLVDTHA
jgi:hypothetical protein